MDQQSNDESEQSDDLLFALPSLLEGSQRFENLRRTLQSQAALAQDSQQRTAASVRIAQRSSRQVYRVTAAQDSDSDDEDSEREINDLFAFGDLAHLEGELIYGENAETILVAPQVGTRVGRKTDDKGLSNKVEAGTVVGVVFQLSFDVLWDKGERETFLVGCKSRTVVVLDCAPAGIQHSRIFCNACSTSTNGIAGMRWKCMECYDYDLCTSCYMKNKHNTGHRFIRFDKENFDGCCVPPRSSSSAVVQSVGFFPGATVQRGPDWKWDREDGGAGSLGKVLRFSDFSDEHPRSGVKVQWASSGTNIYRIGYEGKVDLECVRAAKGLPYYWEHLLKCSVELQQPKPIFDHHQRVKCTLPVDLLESLIGGTGKWDRTIAQFIGKVGIVVGYMANNDVVVQYHPLTVGATSSGQRFVWIFHPAALEKSTSAVPSQPTALTYPMQRTSPSTPTYPMQRTSPSTPTYPMQRTSPSTPTYPMQRTSPSTPTYPMQRTSPSTPTYPMQLTSPSTPTYPMQLTSPLTPTYPMQLTSPSTPTYPMQLTSPSTPTYPMQRTSPSTSRSGDQNISTTTTGNGTAERQCEICMDKVKDTAFVPCGHGACSECAQYVNSCHICRAQITSKLRTYF